MPIQKMFFDPCSWMMMFQFVTKRSGRFWKFDMARGRRGKSLGSQGKKKEERKAAVRKKQGKIGRGKKAKKSKKEKIDPLTLLSLSFEEEMAIKSTSIRKFVVTKINFKANNYTELFDWKTVKFSEPPLTMRLSDDEIRGFILTPLELPQYPFHTQAVERGIKVVSEAASAVIGEEARDGFIRQKLRSRKVFGQCDTKASFFKALE